MTDIGDVGLDTSNPEVEEQYDEEPVYSVKVDGEEIEVNLSELLAGYQRQSSYTRKTQELAKQRQTLEPLIWLQQGLQSDPQSTLAELASVYGVSFASPTPDNTGGGDWLSDDYYYEDEGDDMSEVQALKDELAALKRQMQGVTQMTYQEQVRQEVAKLRSEWGASDEDIQETLRYAQERGFNDIQAAHVARLAPSLRETYQEKVQREAAEKAVQEQKRKAASVTSGQSVARNSVQKTEPSVEGMSWKDTLLAEFAASDE